MENLTSNRHSKITIEMCTLIVSVIMTTLKHDLCNSILGFPHTVPGTYIMPIVLQNRRSTITELCTYVLECNTYVHVEFKSIRCCAGYKYLLTNWIQKMFEMCSSTIASLERCTCKWGDRKRETEREGGREGWREREEEREGGRDGERESPLATTLHVISTVHCLW